MLLLCAQALQLLYIRGPGAHCAPRGALQSSLSKRNPMDQAISRRALLGAAAFTIVPRHVLGAPFVPPSDRINIATIGLGRQGQAVTMSLLPRPEVHLVAVCDVNRGSKNYLEYGDNALLSASRSLLGAGYEKWAEDLASPGRAQFTSEFSSSLGMGGREP